MELKRVLVAGGSGFIGRHLCIALVNKGVSVHVLTRNPDKAVKRFSVPVTLHQSIEAIDLNLRFDAVVNLAGEPLVAGRWNTARKQLIYDSRIDTTDRLCDFFAHSAAPPKVLVSGSAVGYYGPHGAEQLDEQGAAVNGFSHRLCDSWEASAKRFESLGCRVCCSRTGIVLSAEEGALAKMLPAFRLGLGGKLGSGEQWFSWIHIDDMVRLLMRCLEDTSLRGPVNATAPGAVTHAVFTKTLAQVLQRPTLLPMPAFVARLLFGEMADELLLTGQRVYPRKLLEAGFEFNHPDLEPALRSLVDDSD